MKKTEDYKERFKSNLEPEKLKVLIDKDEKEGNKGAYSKEEMIELLKLTGRRTIESIEDGKKKQEEFDEYNKKHNTNFKIPDWALDGTHILNILEKNIDELSDL